MIFQRALVREIASNATVTFVVLFSFMATQTTVRLLSRAVQGRIEQDGILALIGFGLLSSLPVILALTLFIAVLLSISRQYRDSEAIVWFASGQSLLAWLRPVLTFAIPLVLIITALSFWVTPWAARTSELYSTRISNKGDAERIAPGAFVESSNSQRVMFVENIGLTEVKNIFVNTSDGERYTVVVAERGYERVEPEGDHTLVLEKGRRYEGNMGSKEVKIIEFERHLMKPKPNEETEALEVPSKQLIWQRLRDNPTTSNLGELLWRIAVPCAAFVLALLAIPLAFVNPRAGRSFNLIFALLTFFVYLNSINVVQSWVATGKQPFSKMWWSIHVVMASIMLILFANRLLGNAGAALWWRLFGKANNPKAPQ